MHRPLTQALLLCTMIACASSAGRARADDVANRKRICAAAFTLETELSQDERVGLYLACMAGRVMHADTDTKVWSLSASLFDKLSWHGGPSVSLLVDMFDQLPERTYAPEQALPQPESRPPAPDDPLTELVTIINGCPALRSALDEYAAQAAAGLVVPTPLSVSSLVARGCVSLDGSNPKRKLPDSLRGQKILSVFTASATTRAQIIVAGTPAYRETLTHVVALTSAYMRVALVDRQVTTTVRADFVDTAGRNPLVWTYPATRDIAVWADPALACIVIDVASDKSTGSVVYLDHQPVENGRPVLTTVEGHDVHVVSEPPRATDAESQYIRILPTRVEMFSSEPEEVVEREPQSNAELPFTVDVAQRVDERTLVAGKGCYRAHFDLSRRATVTLLPMKVDETCSKHGLDESVVREIASEYLTSLPQDDWRFQDFESWLLSIHGVEELLARLKGLTGKTTGGDLGRAAPDASLDVIAGELARQGFHQAISIGVDCRPARAKTRSPYVVKVTSINLRELLRRGRDATTGTELQGVLREETEPGTEQIAPADAIRAPLARIVGQPYVWFPIGAKARSVYMPGEFNFQVSAGTAKADVKWAMRRLEDHNAAQQQLCPKGRASESDLDTTSGWVGDGSDVVEKQKRQRMSGPLRDQDGTWVVTATIAPQGQTHVRKDYACFELTKSPITLWAHVGFTSSIGRHGVSALGGLGLVGASFGLASLALGGHLEASYLPQPVSWQDLFGRRESDPPLPFKPDGSLSMSWSRRSLWIYPAMNVVLDGWYVRAGLVVDIGFINVSGIPAGLRGFRSESKRPDVDLTPLLMFGGSMLLSDSLRLQSSILLGWRAFNDAPKGEESEPVNTRQNYGLLLGCALGLEGP